MQLTVRALKRIISEAMRTHERYMTRDDAEKLIASMDGDAIAQYDIIDEESGEVYATAGDPFGESQLSPYHVPKKVFGRMHGKNVQLDDGDIDDVDDEIVQDEESVREEWLAALTSYASGWRGWAYENAEEYGDDVDPDQAAQGSASDAADGFFYEHSDWQRWASALGMTRADMKSAVSDYVYEAMMEKAD